MAEIPIRGEEDNAAPMGAALRVLAITEIREMIMDHLDVSALFGIVAAFPPALQTFKKYHRKYFASCLATFSPDWRFIAIALLAVPEEPLSDEGVEQCPRCSDPLNLRQGHFCWKIGIFDEQTHMSSPLYLYLRQYLNIDNSTLPDSISKPVEKLKKLASTVEMVDYLSAAHIWTCVRHPDLGASTVREWGWHRLETSGVDQIKTVLWLFELHCTIFDQRSGYRSVRSQDKFYLMTPLYVRWGLKRVYLDLVRFLALAYEENIVLSFENVYKRRATGFMKIEDLCNEVHNDFLAFVEYQAGLGLPFVVQILRILSDPNRSSNIADLPEQRYKSTSFLYDATDPLPPVPFPPDYSMERRRDRFRSSYWTFEAFELKPCEDGCPGYHLDLALWNNNRKEAEQDRLLTFDRPVFTDGFKPPELGSLDLWHKHRAQWNNFLWSSGLEKLLQY